LYAKFNTDSAVPCQEIFLKNFDIDNNLPATASSGEAGGIVGRSTLPMAVFITGGHGHIGSWAAYFLAREGEQIIVYDTNPTVPDHLTEVADRSLLSKVM